ncbi:chymotrypsin-like protease CTRL-1 [Drosophila ananassae]|uniref:chymotrypsin-like protease CTRL-1 n=1 Tax=Drosophila ananassae TaxID=7217 RepID=UPI000177CCF7|nr:chymotrypsin-like protease CTRL-1 [Drosophila ananassae]
MAITAVIIFFISLLVLQASSVEFLDPECSASPATPRILNGRPADTLSNQWLVFLQNEVTENSFTFCGGSLITNRFVLSAAHCKGELNMYAILGEYNISRIFETKNKVLVDSKILHPDYNSTEIKHDIALFRLSRRVEYTYFIRPVCLPMNYDGLNIVFNLNVTGWGHTGHESISPVLKTATVHVHHRSICYRLGQIDESQLCVGPVDGNTCKGDSGGPLTSLFNFRGTIVTVQIGIVSYGWVGCQGLSVHNHVYYYMNWISGIVRQHDEEVTQKDKDYWD